jgi:hypothetical protein
MVKRRLEARWTDFRIIFGFSAPLPDFVKVNPTASVQTKIAHELQKVTEVAFVSAETGAHYRTGLHYRDRTADERWIGHEDLEEGRIR